ncbi:MULTISPECIES: YggS family pyridoxal phosphate-dependent enzyme [Streptococcus]|uniref:YggS family pyridoxal phosphate-dependent enzyme n=1 Tax=Streptococcus TaxID=1301 RepID=UPI00036ED14A|nr:YggS family pyridoxal phosphate-dependent enzyme [Streptococcus entericus]
MTRLQTEQVNRAVRSAMERAGRADHVTVVAVSKYMDVETTQDLINTGVRHLGENRVDKFLDKYQQIHHPDLTWHFIGSLQRRKVKDVIDYIDYFHALDSLTLAQEIQKRASKVVKCFLQVNISGEESKHGFTPQEVLEALPTIAELDKIEVVGLMTMAPFEASPNQLHQIFAATRQLRDQLQDKQLKNMPLTELSMGMSGDFAIAIQEGASFVRIGSLFFE